MWFQRHSKICLKLFPIGSSLATHFFTSSSPDALRYDTWKFHKQPKLEGYQLDLYRSCKLRFATWIVCHIYVSDKKKKIWAASYRRALQVTPVPPNTVSHNAAGRKSMVSLMLPGEENEEFWNWNSPALWSMSHFSGLILAVLFPIASHKDEIKDY